MSPAQESAKQLRALTYEDVSEAVQTLGKNDILELIREHGVDFELTDEKIEGLKRLGATETLLNLIRGSLRGATLEASCNVECEVLLNQVPLGESSQKLHSKTGLPPGKYSILARAPGYKQLSREIVVQPDERSTQEFQLKSLSEGLSTLDLTCGPSDCDVTLNGTPRGSTDKNRLLVKDLPPGSYRLEVGSKGFRSELREVVLAADRTIPITISLEPESPSKPAAGVPPKTVETPNAEDLLARVLKAVGVDAGQKDEGKYKSTGEMTLVGGKVPRTTAHFSELLWLPDRIRWDLEVAAVKWTIIRNGQETLSGGDIKLKGSDFVQELERNSAAFLRFRLPKPLMIFKNPGVKLGVAPAEEGLSAIVAESSDDRYTVAFDSRYLPVRITHEALTGLRLRTDVFYGRYETQGKLAVPHLVTLRYSDQAGYGHEITYAGVQPDPSIKESMFKRGSRLVFWK